VLSIRVAGALTEHAARVLSAANLRRIAPASMNLELRTEGRGVAQAGRTQSHTREIMPELPLR
jgi:hypothetical protein